MVVYYVISQLHVCMNTANIFRILFELWKIVYVRLAMWGDYAARQREAEGQQIDHVARIDERRSWLVYAVCTQIWHTHTYKHNALCILPTMFVQSGFYRNDLVRWI